MPAAIRNPLARRAGFTLVELLAVLVIIGVLATIAITKFGDSKRRAYLSAMKADLHNLAMIAETRFTSDNSYANVEVPRGSAGITLTFDGESSGWRATARHEALPGVVCTMSAGQGAPPEPLCQ